ncbi:MAG: hypothetical protein WAS33_02500 [Candidatus Promineifilaceae bacterium]|nr:hypothetical protein [Anaerolineaceae bacterium]
MDLAEFFRNFGLTLLTLMGLALLLALLLLAIVWRQVKRIHIPPDATFGETLLLTPFLLVLMIDLLDFALDFLAAPISWLILDRLGLKALRGVSVVETLIPFTQAIPTMTIAWVWVRLFPGTV